MTWLQQLIATPEDAEMIWAFLLAGVKDDHSAQDLLSNHQWDRAEEIYEALLEFLESDRDTK